MDMNRLRELAGVQLTEGNGVLGVPEQPNLTHKTGTGKTATTGSAGEHPSAVVGIPQPNLTHKTGTGKNATTGSAGSAPAAVVGIPQPNLKPVGTGKKATTGLREEAETIAQDIADRVTKLAKMVDEGAGVNLDQYRRSALQKIQEFVNRFVD